MRITIGALALTLFLVIAVFTFGAQQTWVGEISDSHCNAEHQPIAEDDPVLPSPQCVKLCLKSAYKYVFVVDEKVYAITNQDHSDLEKFAGKPVKITGEIKGNSITISKMEPAEPLHVIRSVDGWITPE